MHRVDRTARRRWIWVTISCTRGRVQCYKAGGLNSQSTPPDASTHLPQVPPGFTILKLKARNARMLRLPRNALLTSALCEGLIMRHNHFNLSGLFDLIGNEPASITRDLTAFSWLETCKPAEQTHPRTQARRRSANSGSQPLSSVNGCSSPTSAASKLAPENPN